MMRDESCKDGWLNMCVLSFFFHLSCFPFLCASASSASAFQASWLCPSRHWWPLPHSSSRWAFWSMELCSSYDWRMIEAMETCKDIRYVTIKAIEDIQYSKWLWKWSYDSLDKSESSVLLSLEHACEALLGSHFLSAHHGALSARATTAWLGLVTCFAPGVLMC